MSSVGQHRVLMELSGGMDCTAEPEETFARPHAFVSGEVRVFPTKSDKLHQLTSGDECSLCAGRKRTAS